MRQPFYLLIALLVALSATAQTLEVSSTRKAVRTSGDVFSILLPVAGLTAAAVQQDWTGVKQAAFSGAVTLGATFLLKKAVKKERPDHSDFDSFPSRHTALSFAAATFVQQRYGWQWGLPCYVLSTYVGWTRMYGKKHDWWDVAAGAAIGAGSSFLFTRRFAKKHDLTLCPTTDGHGYGLYASMRF